MPVHIEINMPTNQMQKEIELVLWNYPAGFIRNNSHIQNKAHNQTNVFNIFIEIAQFNGLQNGFFSQ